MGLIENHLLFKYRAFTSHFLKIKLLVKTCFQSMVYLVTLRFFIFLSCALHRTGHDFPLSEEASRSRQSGGCNNCRAFEEFFERCRCETKRPVFICFFLGVVLQGSFFFPFFTDWLLRCLVGLYALSEWLSSSSGIVCSPSAPWTVDVQETQSRQRW